MSLIKSFLYKPQGGFLQRLDPRAKILMVLAFWIVTLIFTAMIIQISLLLLLFTIGFSCGVGGRVREVVRGGALFTLFIIVINYLFYGQVDSAIGVGLRFLVLMVSSSLFFVSTTPEEMGLVLDRLGFPYSLSFALVTATRFIPTLALEAQEIIDAQRSRGLELEKGSFIARVKKYLPILIPLIVNSVKRSLELAEALESRCFGAAEKRTSIQQLKFSTPDYLISFCSLAAVILMVWLRFWCGLEQAISLGV